MTHKAHVITVSDRVSAGTMMDASGPALVKLLESGGFLVTGPTVVADSEPEIAAAILAAHGQGSDLVVTTGGTGLGPRDVTPQATSSLLDYEVPGLGEAMRRAGAEATPTAVLSRARAGVRGRCLIINVPGSVRGAGDSLEAILAVLPHAIQLLQGDTAH